MDAKTITEIFINFYHSSFFSVIKLILGIYATVMILDIVMVVILRGFGKDFRVTMSGVYIPAKKATRKKWQKIKKRLESGSDPQYKLAILEADTMIDKILDQIGHKGDNMPHKLSQIKPGQLEHAEDLMKAHEIRNKIVQDREFKITKETAQEAIKMYEEFLDHFELI
jgi:hypothetical protein